MKIKAAIAIFVLSTAAFAQSNSCLIVKHKGTVGRRLIYFALIGVPIAPGANYDYVDSTNFSNSKMSYKGKQLEEIQSSGTHVIGIEKFTQDAITAAHQSCVANAAAVPQPATEKAPAVAPRPSTEHHIEGYTISGPTSATGSAGSDEMSLGEAARQAKLKKRSMPQN